MGVYASLVNDNRTALIDERLFIPKKWIKDKTHCKAAGIPEEEMVFMTKLALDLEMIDQKISEGIDFDWIGDGLYVHTQALREGIDKRGLFYILDVHKDEKILTTCPVFAIPKPTNKRGRPCEKPQPDVDPTRIDTYIKRLTNKDWVVEKRIRRTH